MFFVTQGRSYYLTLVTIKQWIFLTLYGSYGSLCEQTLFLWNAVPENKFIDINHIQAVSIMSGYSEMRNNRSTNVILLSKPINFSSGCNRKPMWEQSDYAWYAIIHAVVRMTNVTWARLFAKCINRVD